jgi:hypothetical protein
MLSKSSVSSKIKARKASLSYHDDPAERRATGRHIEENTGVGHGGEKATSKGQHGELLARAVVKHKAAIVCNSYVSYLHVHEM